MFRRVKQPIAALSPRDAGWEQNAAAPLFQGNSTQRAFAMWIGEMLIISCTMISRSHGNAGGRGSQTRAEGRGAQRGGVGWSGDGQSSKGAARAECCITALPASKKAAALSKSSHIDLRHTAIDPAQYECKCHCI